MAKKMYVVVYKMKMTNHIIQEKRFKTKAKNAKDAKDKCLSMVGPAYREKVEIVDVVEA